MSLRWNHGRKMIMSDVDNQSKEAPVKNGGGQSLSGVTLLELRIFHCRYIVSEALFCGDPVHRVSYCKTHYRLCYVRAKPQASSQP
jgi:hypothetical protein